MIGSTRKTSGPKVSRGVVRFKSCLKPLGQLKPSLVGMFIGWFYKTFMFFFVDWKYSKNKCPKVSKRGLSLFVCGVFIFQPILTSFFLYVPYKIYLYIVCFLIFLYGSYQFQDIRRSKWDPTPKIYNFYFKSDFEKQNSVNSPRNDLLHFFLTRFDLALMVCEIKGLKRAKRDQHPRWYF